MAGAHWFTRKANEDTLDLSEEESKKVRAAVNAAVVEWCPRCSCGAMDYLTWKRPCIQCGFPGLKDKHNANTSS